MRLHAPLLFIACLPATSVARAQTVSTSTPAAVSEQPADSAPQTSTTAFAPLEEVIEEPMPPPDDDIEEITIIGSRAKPRTAVASPVAIDVIDANQIADESGHVDINRALHALAPSFNSTRQSGADGADHIDPATLRGLGPDQTLVLVNGKRRHQSSLINIFGSRGRGNTGTDLNAIPLAAIERIEVLRDGASALYGSDAIAGVINIVLKKDVGTLDLWATGGAHNAKPSSEYNVLHGTSFDGEMLNASANYGVRVADRGAINFTLDYAKSGHTNRPANPAMLSVYRRQFGDAAYDNFSAWMNAEIPLAKLELYAFGGGSFRDTSAYAWTREADSDRNVPAIYPQGFDPLITSRITDLSITGGVRTELGAWLVDFSNTFGQNRFHYLVENTLNASLLEKSPTRFDAGGHVFSQNITGVHFTRPIHGPIDIYVTLGGEFRIDDYGIFAGEEGSYRNYGLQQQVVDGQVMTVDTLMRAGGSQGFPGLRPDNVVDEQRTNLAAFGEAQVDLTPELLFEAAARVEEYSDFGTTFNVKGAARYELAGHIGWSAMKHMVLRASASTGFRAPSLAQIHYNTTFTDFVGGVPVDKLIAKNDSPVTRALGIPRLKEETSMNVSAGFTAEVFDLRLTVDGYFVDIKDRIVLTGAFGSDDPDIGAELTALGVGAAQFFANALDTRTYGLDVVVDGKWKAGGHLLRAQLGANFNHMELGSLETGPALAGKEDTFFGERERKFLLASAPRSKLTLLLGDTWEPIFFNVIFTRYDEVEFVDWLDTADKYEAKITTDLNFGVRVLEDLRLIVGAMNVFNVYPTQQDTETETGGIWDSVQMGYGGAFYYVKLNARI